MKKETIRPLLVEVLERAQDQEALAERATESAPILKWQGTARALEEWRLARLRRAQAELQLWLADRQWEREELQAKEEGVTVEVLPSLLALRNSKD